MSNAAKRSAAAQSAAAQSAAAQSAAARRIQRAWRARFVADEHGGMLTNHISQDIIPRRDAIYLDRYGTLANGSHGRLPGGNAYDVRSLQRAVVAGHTRVPHSRRQLTAAER